MDEIAVGAGKGKSSLYYYYKNKEEIFAAVVEEETKLLQEKVQHAVSQYDSARDKLRAYFQSRLHYIQELSNLGEAMRNDILNHYEFIVNIRKKYFENEVQTVGAILAQGQQTDGFDIDDLEFTARAIVRVIRAIELPFSLEKQEEDFTGKIDKAIDIILMGIIQR